MFNLDRILSDGCALLAPYLQSTDKPGAGLLTLPKASAYMEANIGKVFVFDRSDIGAYFAAFPEIWRTRMTGTVEGALRIAVTSAVQKSVVARYYVEAAGLDFTIPETDRAFPEVVSLRNGSIRRHAEANMVYEGVHFGHPKADIPRILNTIDLLCLRILRNRDRNDFRLLSVNIDNLIEILTPVVDVVGNRLYSDKVLLSFGQLGDLAGMIAKDAQPLPDMDGRWIAARERADAEQERRTAMHTREEGARRQNPAQRYAVDTEAAMAEFHDAYDLAPETFMVVKKSLENHYGMKPGAIMHFMIAEYDLSFDLWEDGFDEISNAVEAALKASGRTPSVLYPKVSLDRAVRACFGRLDGFENDVEPQPRTIPDYDEGDLIGMEEIGAEPRNAG